MIALFSVAATFFLLLNSKKASVFAVSIFALILAAHFSYISISSNWVYRFIEPGPYDELLIGISIILFCAIFFDYRGGSCIFARKIYFTPCRINSNAIYFLAITLMLVITLMMLTLEKSILNVKYDVHEIGRTPVYEYLGLFSILALSASSSKYKKYFSYVVVLLAGLICAIYSYRMASIGCIFAFGYSYFSGKYVAKNKIIFLMVLGYVAYTSIGYFRHGDNDIDLWKILGFREVALLDNTFTGVLETSIIYLRVATEIDLNEWFLSVLGLVYPLPKVLMPDSLDYSSIAYDLYYMPGGGSIFGFVAYSYFLFIFPLLFMRFILFKRPGLFDVVLFSVSARFILYSPAIFFKYVFLVYIVILSISFFEKKRI